MAKIKAKRGTFLLIQHGPGAKIQNQSANWRTKIQILEILLEELKRIGKEEKADFIRMAPLWERNQQNQDILKSFGFREAPMHANAYEATWKLDITLPEEEILKNMRKTTRYLIHQAMKNQDITVEKSENLDDIEIYQDLNKKVAKRQKFVPFSSEYIKNEFEIFLKDKEIVLFLGKYKGEIDSAALVIFWSGLGFYHQAASNSRQVKLSIPYLILWEAIKEAKKRNCVLFDFWGYVNPKENPRPPKFSFGKLWRAKHPWLGPTLFKMGFGGRPSEYLKTQDFSLSPKYWLTYFFEKLRKFKRNL
ncbi:MAG: hypothetical protein DDT32_02338 [Syntrophomonadaceae bacterium]|nr:hypothetical protein [Bacillota bacterium]